MLRLLSQKKQSLVPVRRRRTGTLVCTSLACCTAILNYTFSSSDERIVGSGHEAGTSGGEGTVSLAYGFANAGVRSLVTSLWRVSDRETADLMARFYAGLRRGLSKDEALRQAKLDYLAEQKSLRAHPFFWAAFVPQGDMSPLDMPGTLPVPLLAGVLAALAAAVFAVRYFRRRAGGV